MSMCSPKIRMCCNDQCLFGMLADMPPYEIMVTRATHGELAATGFRIGGVYGLVGIKCGSQNTLGFNVNNK